MYVAKPSELKVAEAARLLDLTVFSVYLYLKSGKLTGHKRGGHWYVTKASIVRRLGDSRA